MGLENELLRQDVASVDAMRQRSELFARLRVEFDVLARDFARLAPERQLPIGPIGERTYDHRTVGGSQSGWLIAEHFDDAVFQWALWISTGGAWMLVEGNSSPVSPTDDLLQHKLSHACKWASDKKLVTLATTLCAARLRNETPVFEPLRLT
jgi:hypothetical protein